MVAAAATNAAADDKQDCAGKDADRAIRGCTALIGSVGETGKALAVALVNRGAAYASNKDYDRAIADYTRAIEIDPKNAKAYDSRGVAYTSKGDYVNAVADVTMAQELRPKKSMAPAAATAASPAPSKVAAKTPAPKPTKSAAAPRSVAAKASPTAEPEDSDPKWANDARRFISN